MTAQQSDLKDIVFDTLLKSSLPILRATDPNAAYDGAIYNGPISISKIPDYSSRVHAVRTTKPTNPRHKIIGFRIQELQLQSQDNNDDDDDEGTSEGQIRVSVPDDPYYETQEFYILGYSPFSRGKQGDGQSYGGFACGGKQHVAVVPRAVAHHFQTYEAEFVGEETLRMSSFPPCLHPFMVGLDILAEALEGLLNTARVDGAVYVSPETKVRFTGWKVHFVEDLRGLEEVGEHGELAVPDREAGSGGEHYFRYE